MSRKGEGEAPTRVRVPRADQGEIFAIVESMLGANRIRVRTLDGRVVMARIRGKIKKRVWIREGDVVIIVPWEFQKDKADVIWRYTQPQVEWLERNGYLRG